MAACSGLILRSIASAMRLEGLARIFVFECQTAAHCRPCERRDDAVGQTHASHLPAMQSAPELEKPSAPRGRGECRALRRTRSLACKSKKARKQVTTSSPGHPAFPHANGFNGLWRALPGDRALLSPFSASTLKRQCRGDASVEASGPHAFAVRELRLRLLTWLASTASSAQRFVTTAKRPSCSGRDGAKL
jgi:hypothetical protein